MSVNNVFEVKSIRTTNRTNGKLNWVVTIIVICFDWRINNQVRILWILIAIVKLWRFLRQSVLKLFGILECVVYMTFILIMFYWSNGFHLRLKPLFLLKKNPLHLANFRFFFSCLCILVSQSSFTSVQSIICVILRWLNSYMIV